MYTKETMITIKSPIEKDEKTYDLEDKDALLIMSIQELTKSLNTINRR